ncbi:hypothetical protein CCH79_00009544, partial [Gambusia affinis]
MKVELTERVQSGSGSTDSKHSGPGGGGAWTNMTAVPTSCLHDDGVAMETLSYDRRLDRHFCFSFAFISGSEAFMLDSELCSSSPCSAWVQIKTLTECSDSGFEQPGGKVLVLDTQNPPWLQ